ncbi:MAG: hypothetical protein VKK80_15935 [Prochlorothrix sp.]|nr:hypothetical protein [Prochlorothrix sp.]
MGMGFGDDRGLADRYSSLGRDSGRYGTVAAVAIVTICHCPNLILMYYFKAKRKPN